MKRGLVSVSIIVSVLTSISILFSSCYIGGNVNNLSITGTPVSGGTISVNTTWQLLNSPYWIEGNITIADNTSLNIEPGVEVIFNNSYYIYINGIFNVSGTCADYKKMRG